MLILLFTRTQSSRKYRTARSLPYKILLDLFFLEFVPFTLYIAGEWVLTEFLFFKIG